MATPKQFPQAGLLHHLELYGTPAFTDVQPSPLLARLLSAPDGNQSTKAVAHLIDLLKTRRAMLQTAFDTEQVADELRRHQKFARPGQPSPHIVQLRRQQAAARQASNLYKQSYIKAALAFVRKTGIEVPQHEALDVFITRWIDANLPVDADESR